MTSIRRPPPQDLTAAPHRPGRDRWLAVAAVAAVVFAGALGWGLGRHSGLSEGGEAVAELRSLAARHAALLEEREQLEVALGEARVGHLVGTGFDETVRVTLSEQAQRISVLEDEVRFYRSLMASEEDREVRIARLELLERLDGRGIRFRLLLVQSADQSDEVAGRVDLSIVGEHDGASAVLALEEIRSAGAAPLAFRFRYFQDLVGEFELPEGFRPEAVQVVATGEGSDGFRLERTFGWQVQEG